MVALKLLVIEHRKRTNQRANVSSIIVPLGIKLQFIRSIDTFLGHATEKWLSQLRKHGKVLYRSRIFEKSCIGVILEWFRKI